MFRLVVVSAVVCMSMPTFPAVQNIYSGSGMSLVQIQANAKFKPASKESTRRGNCGRQQHEAQLIGQRSKWVPTSHMILIPSAKLAFCTVAKDASSDFVRMFAEANGVTDDNCESYCEDYTARLTSDALGVNPVDITKSNGWTFAHFVRDPLERYLSAYGSKCCFHGVWGIEDEGSNCCGDLTGHPNSTSSYIEDFQARALSDLKNGLPLHNCHWMPQVDVQALQCGQFNWANADYVGILSGDVNSKVKDMLKMARVKNYNKLADKFFPPTGEITGHHASTTSGDIAYLYSNPEVVKAVAKLYERDYAAFPLPRPKA